MPDQLQDDMSFVDLFKNNPPSDPAVTGGDPLVLGMDKKQILSQQLGDNNYNNYNNYNNEDNDKVDGKSLHQTTTKTSKKRKEKSKARRSLRLSSNNNDVANANATTASTTANANANDDNAQNSSSTTKKNDTPEKLIFTKDSPYFVAFIELVKRMGWANSSKARMPTAKQSPEIAEFMKMTGFTRAQLTRKFGEYVRTLWMNRPSELECDDDDSKSSTNTDGAANVAYQPKRKRTDLVVLPKNTKAKTESNESKENNSNNGVAVYNNESFIPRLPPVDLETIRLALSDYQQQHSSRAHSNICNSNTTTTTNLTPDLGALIAFSPLKPSLSAFSESSPPPRVTYHPSSALSPCPALQESLQVGALTTLDRRVSWATRPPPPPPPAFNRIQTKELENMLKGNLLPERFQVTDQEYEQLKQWQQWQVTDDGGSQSQGQRRLSDFGANVDNPIRYNGFYGFYEKDIPNAATFPTQDDTSTAITEGTLLWNNASLPPNLMSPGGIPGPTIFMRSEPFSPSAFLSVPQQDNGFGNTDETANAKANVPVMGWTLAPGIDPENDMTNHLDDYMPSSLESLEDLDKVLYS